MKEEGAKVGGAATSSSKRGQSVPIWLKRPFREYIRRVETLGEFVHLTMSAIARLRNSPRLVEAMIHAEKVLAEVGDKPRSRKDAKRRLALARKEAALAQKEVDQAFPLLHEQAVVSLWSWTEDVLLSLLAGYLRNTPAAMAIDQVRKVRVSLSDYHSLDRDERFAYIIAALDRDVSGPLKQGINRFETLLAVFSLSSEVGDAIAKDLFELSQVRNVLVHRGGVADRRLVLSCPWLGLRSGQPVRVTHEAFGRYVAAALRYGAAVVKRLRARVALPAR